MNLPRPPFGPPRTREEEKRAVRGYLMLAGFLAAGGLVIGFASRNFWAMGVAVWPLLFALYYTMDDSEDDGPRG